MEQWLELKLKIIEVFVKGISITFAFNIGLVAVLWDKPILREDFLFIVILVMNGVGLFGFLCFGWEANKDFETVKKEAGADEEKRKKIKMKPVIFYIACPLGFVLLVLLWMFVRCYDPGTSANPITITSSEQARVDFTGPVTITSLGQVKIDSKGPASITVQGRSKGRGIDQTTATTMTTSEDNL